MSLMIYFKPASDIIILVSLFTSWEESRNPTPIFSSAVQFQQVIGESYIIQLQNVTVYFHSSYFQLLTPPFNCFRVNIAFPEGKKKKKELVNTSQFWNKCKQLWRNINILKNTGHVASIKAHDHLIPISQDLDGWNREDHLGNTNVNHRI